eukprot:950298-Rhodomonas_salina.1
MPVAAYTRSVPSIPEYHMLGQYEASHRVTERRRSSIWYVSTGHREGSRGHTRGQYRTSRRVVWASVPRSRRVTRVSTAIAKSYLG